MSREIKSYEQRKNTFQKKANYAGFSSSSNSEDVENTVDLAKWVKNKKPILCPFGKKELEEFGFDITKADKIFDLLLLEG